MAEHAEIIDEKDGVTVLRYGNHLIKVKPVGVEDEVDPDKITKIDINNLVAEIITTPVLVNRWGNILADVESDEKKMKLKLDIFCAKQKEAIRIELQEKSAKKPTIGEVDDTLIQKKAYQIMKNKHIEAERMSQIVTSIFWAVKDKSDKLNKLSLTIQKEDIDTIQSIIINGVKVVAREME